MKQKSIKCIVLLPLFLLDSMVSSQTAATSVVSSEKVIASESARYGLTLAATTWTRTAFEAGVTYQETDQVAVTTTTCPPYGWAADWYDRSVSWTSSGPAMPANSSVPHHMTPYNGALRDLVANGSYPVYARDAKPSTTDKPLYDET